MSNDIHDIIERLKIVEGKITPVGVKQGLNAQQKSVPQLPALFKPRDISTVLGAKKDPEHPAKKYFVGGESEEVQEDLLSKVKKGLNDYLKSIEDEVKGDSDLPNKQEPRQSGDVIGPAVKTITSDDGHEFKIHGNEDDGFRITVREKPMAARFDTLDHAVMACEMYCNRRRVQNEVVEPVAAENTTSGGMAPMAMPINQDYLEEE